jgi:hypothetical protein
LHARKTVISAAATVPIAVGSAALCSGTATTTVRRLRSSDDDLAADAPLLTINGRWRASAVIAESRVGSSGG